IMSKHTGTDISRLEHDTDRDYFMSSQEAREYGIIDHVLTSRAEMDSYPGQSLSSDVNTLQARQ
ncbi:MAG: ATP-dependent Clp protease proteolytic subunit, partial [Desulfonatronovibrio sp.]|nr:ATP-dependent Clp protease proteolytic subunit [Desulfovibrionales bacterium]